MSEILRTRHWIADCDSFDFGIAATEYVPGQFDGIPHESYEISCIVSSHGRHTMRPVSKKQYDAVMKDDIDG
jgi:hypothetical protein